MKDITGVLLSSFGLIYFLAIAFIVWFRPKQYMAQIHDQRKKLKSRFAFIPDWFIGFIFFYEHPGLSIWWARILVLIAVLICAFGLIASIHGPF